MSKGRSSESATRREIQVRSNFQKILEKLDMAIGMLQPEVIQLSEITFDVMAWLAVLLAKRQLSLGDSLKT